MSPSNTTPDYKFDAFDWLPIEKWDANTLLNDPVLNHKGKRYCKLCDEWVVATEAEKHARAHKRQQVARLEKKKKDSEAHRIEALELARREKAALRKAEQNTNKEEKNMDSTPQEVNVPADRFTTEKFASENNLSLPDARRKIKEGLDNGTIVVVGKVETGKRGRPPLIYAQKGE